jgi:DNA repair protein RecO (recombination protein O)
MQDGDPGRRQRLYRLAAIVLRRRDLGEADRLLTVFTRDRGKLSVLAKGVRRAASRKAGHIEPFTYVDLLVAKGQSLDIITQAETIASHRELRDDLWRSSWAYYVAELVDAFTREEDPNALLFDLLQETLGRLAQGADPALVTRYYELHLLALVGYQPQFFHCIHCGAALKPELNFLSPAQGGCLCPQHGAHQPDAVALALPALKVLRFLQSRSWPEVAALQIGPETASGVEGVLARYIVYHLERTVRSATFLERLRGQISQPAPRPAGS